MLKLRKSPNGQQPNNEIWYRTSDEKPVAICKNSKWVTNPWDYNQDDFHPYNDENQFGAKVIDNTYDNGKGVLKFNRDVTKIDYKAFCCCEKLIAISVPESVIDVTYGAFRCGPIAEVVFHGNNLTRIGRDTFESCLSLKNLTIPENVETIGRNAFHLDTFESIILPQTLTLIDEDAFKACSKLKEIIIPNNVQEIGNNAFTDCLSLTSITIGSSIKSIGYDCFNNDTNVVSIYVNSFNPPKLNLFDGRYPFDSIPKTSKIYVPASCVDVYKNNKYWERYSDMIVANDFGEYIIDECTSLKIITKRPVVDSNDTTVPIFYTAVTNGHYSNTKEKLYGVILNGEDNSEVFGDNKTEDVLTKEATYTYHNKKSSVTVSQLMNTNVNIPDNEIWYTTTNNEGIVVGFSDIDSFGAKVIANVYKDGKGVITFESPVTQIGTKHENAPFIGNRKLKTITLPKTVKSLGYGTFSNCRSLQQIIMPDYSVENINAFAFAETVIEHIKLPLGLKTIEGFGVFQNCHKLKEILVPDSVVTMNSYHMFNGCYNLTTAVVGDSVLRVGNDICFGGCYNLTNVYLGKSSELLIQTFKDCIGLTCVEVPESVKYMVRTFISCENLKKIIMNPLTPPNIDEDEFKFCPNDIVIEVPKASYETYINNEQWKKYKDRITIA